MRPVWRFSYWIVGFACIINPGAWAFMAPQAGSLPNIDRRAHDAAPRAAETRAASFAQLNAVVPNVRVDFDEVIGSPKWVTAHNGFLTGPDGTGRGVSAAASARYAGDPYRATKGFLDEQRKLFGFGAEALTNARVSREFVMAHNGVKTVVWQQQLDGINVFDAVLISHATKRDELVSVSSQFIPNPAAAAEAGTPNRAALVNAPTITAQKALTLAVENLGESLLLSEIRTAGDLPETVDHHQTFQAPSLNGNAEVRLVWLPTSDSAMTLCWEVVLTSKLRNEMFRTLVAVDTGDVLVRRCLTEYATDASFRVYTSDSPSPFSPGHPTPLSTQPALVSRSLITFTALNTNASPNGWIDDGVNETRGNNVDAHTDRNDDDIADTPRPQGSPYRTFDFAMDLNQAPSTYTNASVTQLFYTCNWMHDKLYELGFTEAAGNFQVNNFGRGGLGNDALQADAQDGGGTDNANMSTPTDGYAPRMQMYVFTGPTPDRDGDFDAEIVLHEYTHGLSNRRVGGGVGLSALQSEGMGEGWSDWYGLTLLSESADDVNGVYAAGAYATYMLSGLTQNYYYGIRRYPYCTDMSKNPLTFRDIDPAQASSHAGIPRSPIIGSTANEVHNMGEVWCVTLWEARANLINKYGFSTGNQMILQLVTDGMNLSPVNPNFLQARDGILQADVLLNGGADLGELWTAFAKRGMGYSATSPSSYTTTGLVEAYDIPDDLTVSPSTGFTSTGPVGGPFNPISKVFNLANIGSSSLNWGAGTSASWLALSQTSGTLAVGATNAITVSLAGSAAGLPMGIYSGTVAFSNLTSGLVQTRTFALRVGQPDYFTELFDAGDFDVTNQTLTFTPDGSTNFYSVCREPAVAYATDPTGGTSIALGAHTYTTLILTNPISIYGQSSSSVYLASEGHLTLFSPDSSGSVTLANHFSRTRVSASLAHIHPTENGGTVTWKQMSNRVAITFHKVVEYASTRTNSFQIELFYDGRIRMTHLTMATTTGLVGLSRGTGIPVGFIESDLSSYGPCVLPMTVTIPHSVAEGNGVLSGQGIVNIFAPSTTNVTVTLKSSDTSEITVPASVTILAGQTTTNFNVTVVDDPDLDGVQLATVTASAPGYAVASDTTQVSDNETATLTVSLPPSVTEGTLIAPLGSVTASAPPVANITVSLSSSDTTEIQVPASVTIPAGQTSVVFNVTTIDDTQIDGDQTATVTAHVPNWTDGFASIVVHDNEPTNIVVTLPSTAREGDGTLIGAGAVKISGTLPNNLTVSLLSSDTTELTVPLSTTIFAGQTSATFNLTVVDDPDIDGSQNVFVTASATGFSSGVTNMTITDNESPPLPFAPSPAHLATNVIQTADLAWQSGAVPGEIITNDVYFGTNPNPGAAEFLGTTTATSWPLPTLYPQTTYYWKIVARKAGVTPGPIWQFTTRGLDHFTWSAIPSPQYVSQPFSATLIAKDAFETTVSNFTGTVNLSASSDGATVNAGGPILLLETSGSSPLRGILSSLGRTYTVVQTAVFTNLDLTGYSTIVLAMGGGTVGYADMAYLANAVNAGTKLVIVGGSAWASYSMGLNDFFIRVNTNNYNWNTVLGSPHFYLTQPGHPLAAQLPATYNFLSSSSTYYATRVTDINATNVAFNGDGYPSLTTKRVGAGTVAMFINIGTDGYWPYSADLALLNTVVSNSIYWVESNGSSSIPITPTIAGAFTNGSWTDSITALAPTTNVVLRADDGSGHIGTSNPFAVQLQNDVGLTLTEVPNPVSLGGNAAYAINVTNIGPLSATGVFVTNRLPATISLASVTTSQGTIATNGSVLVFNLGTLTANSSATINIIVTANSVGTLTNQTTVARAEADAYLANNSGITITSVRTPVVSITNPTLYEGNSGTANAVFAVSVSPPPATPVTVSFTTADVTAVAPEDYIATNGVLNFSPGETNKTISVTVKGDTYYEPDEMFTLNLYGAINASISNSQGVATIQNDDPMPLVSIGDVTLTEGNSGTTNAVFPVSLTTASGVAVIINYYTTSGNATSGSDYTYVSGSLTIPAGIISTNITVPVFGDLQIEPDEVFYVDLSSAANAILLKREAYCLIVNDDGLPGQLDHFVWSSLATTQYVGIPFGVTISALDAFNAPATSFSGPANLYGLAAGSLSTNTILGNLTYVYSSSGSYTLGYSFTPSTNIVVTHVRSYSGTKVSIWTDAGTLLVAQPVSGSSGTWTETALGTPLMLSAGITYRVAVYTGGGNYYYRYDGTNKFADGTINASYQAYGDVFPNSTDSVRWWFVDLRYNVGSSATVPITPTLTGTFTNGLWTGNMAVLTPATNMVLRVDDGNSHVGTSTPFSVELRNDIALRMSATPDTVAIGANVNYSIIVTNVGPSIATSVVVTNILPASVTLLSANASQGTVSSLGNLVTFNLGTLGANSFATISIQARANSVGSITNLATVYRGESDAFLGNNSASVVTLVQMPALAINSTSVLEGNNGLTPAVFTVSLLPAAVTNVTVNFATVNGTALAGSDYIATNGSLTFPPGQTNLPVTVLVIGDTNREANETFSVVLSNPTNAIIAAGTGTGTIRNDESTGIVAYFTDNASSATGWSAPILQAGFVPQQVGDISTLDLSTVEILVIDESDNTYVTSALQARLPAIQSWIVSGGKLVVHDRSAGNLSPNPFLLGYSNTPTMRYTTADLDVIPPGTNTVVSGPHGTINNSNLDGGSSSAHGYVAQNNLPLGAEPIISIGGLPSSVVCFSYPLGAGSVYYSTIPLDCYLSSGGCSGSSIAYTLQTIYSPNVLVYSSGQTASTGIAPTITAHPTNRSVIIGTATTFSVSAWGSFPLTYQWQKNDVAIPGATNSTYSIASVQSNHAGAYSVLVSNLYGQAISSNALLTVLPGPNTVLSRGNLTITLNNYSAGITSALFQGAELYRVGTYISDWGLQTGSNTLTFVNNPNGGIVNQPMSLVASDATTASYTGNYITGGANVALSRYYSLAPNGDVLQTISTFQNNGASNITLRCFETFDVDWYYSTAYYSTFADRYVLNTNGARIQIGRSIIDTGTPVVLLGTVDTNQIIAACHPSYFGITTATSLNTFFSTAGADSDGADVDRTLDIGKQISLAPGASASFVFYQCFATNIATAEQALINNAITNSPVGFNFPQFTSGSLSLQLGALDGSPLTPERAAKIQIYCTTDLQTGTWNPVTNACILTNGRLQVSGLSTTNSESCFFRAVEAP